MSRLVLAFVLAFGAPAEAQRSAARTWAGVGIMAGGAFATLFSQRCDTYSGSATETVPLAPFHDVVTTVGADVSGGRMLGSGCVVRMTGLATEVYYGLRGPTLTFDESDFRRLGLGGVIDAAQEEVTMRNDGMFYGGIAAMGAGVLLATVFADDPAWQVSADRREVRVSRRFGW